MRWKVSRFTLYRTKLQPGLDPLISNYRLHKDDRNNFPRTRTDGAYARNTPENNRKFPDKDFLKILNSVQNIIIAGNLNAAHRAWSNARLNAFGYAFREIVNNKPNVDHFGYSNQDVFKQRYLSNLKFYNEKNGTIFFYTGNEGAIEMFANNTGFMWEIAAEFNAALIFAEHRYYGKSLPYGELSFENNTYRGYLTTEQALADFASLIYHLKNELPGGQKAPVIAFGGSYGGMLSAWIRIKYPHLVNGALSSSAPILLFSNAASCKNFPAIITDDFKNAGISCANNIRKSWSIIRKIGKSENGSMFLTKTFKTCQSIHPVNVSSLIGWLESTWAYLAMTDYPYPTNFLNPLPANPIDVTCKFLIDESVDDETLVINIAKAANYQECTEMVSPECSTGTTDMFEPKSWDFNEFSLECWKKFNVKPNENVSYIMYGGKDITASSNIIFTNGRLDPWYGGGILQSLSDTLIAIVIEDAAHHLDLRSSNAADPDSVKNARYTIKKWIYKWISEYKIH
ncbi:lysosomal Pro-X carboxypeptidase [Trichonephila inaurata madagascariensis]|uniref:Lysosomal Pro-X carboxypeptidase n=1 Tax=Trichonephila inaurata madagascariensis TaxID=2747483 RepID=A0A8X6YE70_9ARAC|nr:lysosomal Pro-X carboxypeptidase [Trichonephila inaurata madagascariensis]